MTAPAAKRARIEDDDSTGLDGSKPIQLQRRRVWRACEECRRKKIKCDSREPVCSQCSTTGATCKWTQTKDRAALSRHYVQELEARLLYMEQLFKQHAPDVEVFPQGGSGLPPQMAKNVPALAPFPSATRPLESAGKEDDLELLSQRKREDESTLSDHFGQMALDAEGHLRWIGGSSTMTLIETFRNETAGQEDFRATPSSDQSDGPNMLYFPTGLGFGKLQALPAPEEVEYPERDLADLLVQAYFERFHFLLPVLDKPSFLRRYEHLMDNEGRGEKPGFVAVVFAVFACAARFLDDPRMKSVNYKDTRDTAMVFYERAMMLYYIDHTSTQFSHVQCFALLSAFLASLNRLPQAWLLVGQAVRTAQDLGLHRSPKPLKVSNIDKETRRKVWWCVYGLDRCLAVQLGRPLGIEDVDIDVDMPVPCDDVDLPQWYEGALPDRDEPPLMQGFVALTSLYQIAGQVLRHVYATDKLKGNITPEQAAELHNVVDKLDLQLTKWCDDLHPNLRQSPTTPQMVSMSAVLCSTYYAVLITLHRNFLPTRRNLMLHPGSTSVPKAVCASRSCIFLATSMNPAIPPSHHLAVFVQSLFSSAIIILLVVMHATDKNAAEIAMSEVGNCVSALETLEPTWPGASKCKEILIELADVTRANLAKIGQPKAPRHTPRSSVQLPSGSGHTTDSQGASPNSQGSVGRSPQAANGAHHRSTSTHQYTFVGGSSAHSTPSPPHINAQTKRPPGDFNGLPLTVKDERVSKLLRPQFGTDLSSQQFQPQIQQGYSVPSWRLPSPPTFLSNPKFYGNHAQDFPASQDMSGLGPSSFAFYSTQDPTVSSAWAADAGLDTADLPSLNGMDFMQNFGPSAQLQGEGLWDHIPGVFNVEPRAFGMLDDFSESQLN